MKTKKLLVFSLAAMLLALPFLFLSGAGGCGGGGTGGGGGGGTETGVTVDSVSDIPSLNIDDYYDTGSAASALKAQTTGDEGGFCTEFCYLNQCLQETLRHSIEIEFFLCMSRKAKEATGGTFDFPAGNGCNFFEVTPPEIPAEFGGEGEGGGPPVALNLKKGKLQTIGALGLFQMRLCRNGDTVTFHMCEDGSLHQEISITNNTAEDSISATATNAFAFGECEDRGQMSITSNCEAAAFTSSECIASFNAKFNGCFGAGTINYSVTGGTTRTNNLEANFSAGGEGADAFGSFDVCVLGEWTGGANGCFKSDASGSFPSFPAADFGFLGDIPGCETLAASNPVNLCPNDNFDPELCFDESGNYIPTNCPCPFAAAEGTTCPFSFADTQCCSISGATIEEQTGTIISDTEAGDLFTEIDAATCPEAESEVNFLDEWNCEPETSFVPIEFSDTTVDFSECFELFAALSDVSAGDNCQQDAVEEGSGEIIGEIEGSACTTDDECPEGEVCDPAGFCFPPPPTCTTDADCLEGESCIFVPDLGGNVCVPTFVCESDFDCPPDATCNLGTGECEF
jgi:Cys-rich repeat protein